LNTGICGFVERPKLKNSLGDKRIRIKLRHKSRTEMKFMSDCMDARATAGAVASKNEIKTSSPSCFINHKSRRKPMSPNRNNPSKQACINF
jgi:hypothetical protein